MMKEYGVRINKAGVFIHEGKRMNFIYTLTQANKLKNAIAKKVINEETYISNITQKTKNDSRKLNAFINRKKKLDFSKLSNNQIFAIYQKYNLLFTEMHFPISCVLFLGIDEVIKKIKKYINHDQEIQILSKPSKPPYLLEYEYDLSKNLSTEKLTQKWHWVPFDYYGADEWDKAHFKKAKTKETNNYINYQQQIKIEKEKIINKYVLTPKQKRLAWELGKISYLQDLRKKLTNMTYPFLQKKVIAEFSNRTELPKEHIWLMAPQEIQKALEGKKVDIRHRLKECAFEISENKFVIHKKIPNFLKTKVSNSKSITLKGISAYRGVVRGRVRLCLTSQQTKKMKKGEIMVAPSTTPDFILGFKKASAIVTDEGGITSHAAVVSREMKIPCLIGTKNATRSFKNGDILLVDANKEFVKLISRID